MAKKCDFSGWGTKNNVRCTDGRIIRKNAFADQDGQRVPLFWNHQHNDPEMVLGHAFLFNKDDGVYVKGYFNDSSKAQHTKNSIAHGDLFALSIYANQLQEHGGEVLHGIIREVSVVPGGANPAALIESAMLAHGDVFEDDVMMFINDDPNALLHSGVIDDEDEDKDEEEEVDEKEEVKDKKKPKKTKKDESDEEEDTDESDDGEGEDSEEEEDDEMKHSATNEKTVGDVLKTLNDEQKKAVAVLIDAISKDDDDDDEEDDETEDNEEKAEMKHNVFDNNEGMSYGPVLSHSDMQTIFEDWKRYGSLKKTIEHHIGEGGVIAHSVTNADGSNQAYGIADIDYLFPDAKAINTEPDFISRQMDWVQVVMNGTRHTPFSNVKSIHADITMEEARAKGYIKGHAKVDEVFSLLKRVTTPQTIYKKQSLDRDDIVDITDFNVVSWIKAEMRLMLEEECARAILVGDGRSVASADHISEEHIRPIWKDAELYTIKVTVPQGTDEAASAKNFITNAIKARKKYRGSGNTILFTSADMHTEMALLEDNIGRPLYDTDEKLCQKLRVSRIVDVEPMENLTNEGKKLLGIIVDLRDYNIGADRGGQTNFFDDFDIDYNKEKYLIETRFSGALIKPKSAIVLELAASSSSSSDNDGDDGSNG